MIRCCNNVDHRRLGPQAIQICFDVCSIHQMLLWGPGQGWPRLGAGAILAPGEIKILIHETNWASCHTRSHRRNNLSDCNLYFPPKCGHLSTRGHGDVQSQFCITPSDTPANDTWGRTKQNCQNQIRELHNHINQEILALNLKNLRIENQKSFSIHWKADPCSFSASPLV